MKGPTRLLRPLARGTIAAVSRDRVAGERLRDACATASELRKRGYQVCLAYWNRDGEAPATVLAEYRAALEAIAGLGGNGYLSIKAQALAFDESLYGRLLTEARERQVPLHFDSVGPEVADRIFTMITDHTAPPLQTIGCTLPGRWTRSQEDAARLASLGAAVRVVKGEWPDPDSPTLDPARGFLDVVTRLAGKASCVRVATHDFELARESVRILRRAGTPCDVELLYGFPVRRLLPRLRGMGVPVRVYVPFGHGWIPYCMKHVRAHPSFLLWLVRDSLAGSYRNGFLELEACKTK